MPRNSKNAKGTSTKESQAAQRETRSYWLGIIGSVVTLVSVATAAILFLENRAYELRTAETKQEYERKLRSIEFGLGDKRLYRDVSQVLLARSQVPTLPSNVKRFDLSPGIAFFVEDYAGGEWLFEPTDELALTEMMVGHEQTLKEAGSPEVIDHLRESKIYLFRHPDMYQIDLGGRRRDENAAPKLMIFPVIAVETLDHKFFGDMINAPPAAREEVRRLLISRSTTTDPLQAYTVDERLASALDDMFRNDFAGQVLDAFLDGDLKYVKDYSGVQHNLLNVQKQQNALAIESELLFLNVPVEGRGTTSIQVNEVIWFFNGPDRSFLVRAFIPHIANKPNPYDEWVRRWLTGFKFAW